MRIMLKKVESGKETTEIEPSLTDLAIISISSTDPIIKKWCNEALSARIDELKEMAKAGSRDLDAAKTGGKVPEG